MGDITKRQSTMCCNHERNLCRINWRKMLGDETYCVESLRLRNLQALWRSHGQKEGQNWVLKVQRPDVI